MFNWSTVLPQPNNNYSGSKISLYYLMLLACIFTFRGCVHYFAPDGGNGIIAGIPLETYPDGFLGINFHYLPIPLRVKLLDRLVDFSNNTKFDESTRLVVDYSQLKNINIVKPTIHKYLAGQLKSQFRRIDADEFTIATLLPVQRFQKASASAVWKESRAMI